MRCILLVACLAASATGFLPQRVRKTPETDKTAAAKLASVDSHAAQPALDVVLPHRLVPGAWTLTDVGSRIVLQANGLKPGNWLIKDQFGQTEQKLNHDGTKYCAPKIRHLGLERNRKYKALRKMSPANHPTWVYFNRTMKAIGNTTEHTTLEKAYATFFDFEAKKQVEENYALV